MVDLSATSRLVRLGGRLWRELPIAREFRINDRIRVREVRLIDDEGGQLGVVPLYQALELAREKGLDLVEVAPNAVPPVCRILDYGKFKYEQSKKEREARKHQHNVVLREIRMKPKIDEHDVDFKTRTVEKLLKEGDKVKVSVMMRGRELAHPEIGRAILARIFERVKDHGVIEKPAGQEGRHITMILAPGVAKAPKEPPRNQPPPEARGEPVPVGSGGGPNGAVGAAVSAQDENK